MAPADRGENAAPVPKKDLSLHSGAAGGAFLHHSAGAGLHLYLTADGHEKQLYIAERGALCGESACLQRQPHASAALAIVDTWAYAVPRLAMLEALREDWALNQRFLELCFRKNTVLLGQVRELSFDQAERRIARTLLNLAAQYGRPCPEGVRISIRFTHQDVAGIINTSRITTNKVMKRMEEEGILLKREGRYILRALPALERLARGEGQ